MPVSRENFGVYTDSNKGILYVSGGTNEKFIAQNSVHCYDFNLQIWKNGTSMTIARPNCKLIGLNNTMIAIDLRKKCPIEKFDFNLNSWLKIHLPKDCEIINGLFGVSNNDRIIKGEKYVDKNFGNNEIKFRFSEVNLGYEKACDIDEVLVLS